MKAREHITAPRTQVTLSFVHKQSIGERESQGSHPLPGYLQGKISVMVIIWKGYKMAFFLFSFLSLEISQWLCLTSRSWARSLFLSLPQSLPLCLFPCFFLWLFLCFYLFLSLSFGLFLSFFSPLPVSVCVFVYQYLSLRFSLFLWFWFCLHFPLCFFLSASLWFPLWLCLSDHLSGLYLILSPSFLLSFIPFLPPCSPFLVAPGFLGKVE